MDLNLKSIKEAYDDSPFAFCVIKVIADNTGKAQDFTFEYANNAMAILEGTALDKLLKSSFNSLFHKIDGKWVEMYGETAFSGGSQTITDYRPEIDKYLQIRCYQMVYGYCGCLLSDVTKEKKIEISLQAETKLQFQAIQRIYNNIPGAVFQCTFSKEWTVLKANDGFYKFLGYTKEEFSKLFNNNSVAVIHPDDRERVYESTALQASKGGRIRNQMRAIQKGGSVRWIDMSSDLIRDESGLQSFYCVFVDITEQKEMEEYNGPRTSDHRKKKDREHGRIEITGRSDHPCHEEATQRNSRPRLYWRCWRVPENWKPSQQIIS